MTVRSPFVATAVVWLLLGALPVSAQSAPGGREAGAVDDLAPPVPPAVMTRAGTDRVIVRATRITKAIVVDGRLDDEVYAQVAAIGGFVQQEPHEGAPATEQTEVWFLFDDENVYISARCWDSHPEREVTKEMRRDHVGVFDNEYFQ